MSLYCSSDVWQLGWTTPILTWVYFIVLTKQNSKYIFTPLHCCHKLDIWQKILKAFLTSCLCYLHHPCSLHHIGNFTTLRFISHILGYPGSLVCATRCRDRSSGILNGPTFIFPVKIKRKTAKTKLNLYLLPAMLTPEHLSIPSTCFKSRNTMVYRGA